MQFLMLVLVTAFFGIRCAAKPPNTHAPSTGTAPESLDEDAPQQNAAEAMPKASGANSEPAAGDPQTSGKPANPGCWAEQGIEELVLRINGTHLPDKDLPTVEPPTSQAGSAAHKFALRLADGLEVEFDETSAHVFTIDGIRRSRAIPETVRIKDLTFFQLEKLGTLYLVDKRTFSSFFTKRTEIVRVREAARYALSDVAIEVHGQTLLKVTDAQFTFESGSLSYEVGKVQFKENPAFIELMKRSDCP